MRCLMCGGELYETSAPMIEEYRGERFKIDGIKRHVCRECGEDVMSAEMADRLAKELVDAYAHAHGLLTPSEIRGVRTRFGLRQSDFERLLGVSTPTCSRWETGAVQQSRTADKLMRVIRDVPGVYEYLADDSKQLSVIAGAKHSEEHTSSVDRRYALR